MAYSITAAKLKQLQNTSFATKTRDGSPAKIRIPPQPPKWPRGGSEAYGLKTELEIQRPQGLEHVKAFLKIFKTDVPERRERTLHLIKLALAKKSDFYAGVPFGWIGRVVVNGVEISAHFTRMIPGSYDGGPEDFKVLRQTSWAMVDEKRRKNFAGELVCAVAGLESAGIVHGDISPGNLLFGSTSTGREICILCDYDGYYHPGVARLPRKHGGLACRPLGSPGYQYPELVGELQRDAKGDGDIWVKTDRFALAVAICEMMTWSAPVEKLLETQGRDQLLPDEAVSRRDISVLPKPIRDRFPEGFELLDKALQATDYKDMPSPEEWLTALGFKAPEAPHHVYLGKPIVTVFQRHGTSRAKHKVCHLANATGDLGSVAPGLRGATYHLTDKKLSLRFPPGQIVRRRRAGRLAKIPGAQEAVGNPGDIYIVGPWELELSDVVTTPVTA